MKDYTESLDEPLYYPRIKGLSVKLVCLGLSSLSCVNQLRWWLVR